MECGATTEADKAEAPVTTEAAPAKEVTYQAEAAPCSFNWSKPELKTEKLSAYVAEIEGTWQMVSTVTRQTRVSNFLS